MKCDTGGYCSGSYAQDICDGCATKGMPCTNGLECCWGNTYAPNPASVLPTNQWVCLEIMARLNTPARADGEMALWMNGVEIHRVRGMHWRDVPELQLNKAWLQHYIASGDATQSNRIWFDDMVVSTEHIGYTGSAIKSKPLAQPAKLGVSPTIKLHAGICFKVTLARPGGFLLCVLDISGREIWQFKNGEGGPGSLIVNWDRKSASRLVGNGTYIVIVRQGEQTINQKFALSY